MKLISIFLFLILFCGDNTHGQKKIVPPAIPSKQQLAWHEMEFYLFAHFGPNTFTDKEWGEGDEPEDIFNPSNLDCDQWCRIAKAAGAKGIIITAKHHDGFCLWPSKYSTHTVRESKWKNGKGDVLKELAAACKRHGLKFGVYLSPWDRNHPKYGTPQYNDVFVNMMKEVFQNYGPIWEFWWDGANGEGPNGKRQEYDWNRFEKTVRQLSPTTIVFSDIGPDIRWVGNEKGIAAETNWNLLDTAGFKRGLGAPPTDTLQQGNVNGKNWIPAECDVSIRPGWFYHAKEDQAVKSPEELFDLYLKSVGRGANFLLNVPPDRRGLINERDSLALMGFYMLRKESFQKNLALSGKGSLSSSSGMKGTTKLNDRNPSTYENAIQGELMVMKLEGSSNINCITIREHLGSGQQVNQFRILLMGEDNVLLREIAGTTIGRKRIITFPTTSVHNIAIVIDGQKKTGRISEIEVYLIDEKLIERKK
jgi:alpha-L-fucosidase